MSRRPVDGVELASRSPLAYVSWAPKICLSEATPETALLDTLKKAVALLDRRDRTSALVLAGAMFLGALVEMVGVGAVPLVVSTLADPDAVRAHAVAGRVLRWMGVSSSAGAVQAVGLILVSVYALKAGVQSALAYALNRWVLKRQVEIALRLYGSFLARPYPFHLQRNSSVLIRDIAHSAMGVGMWALRPMLFLTMEGLTLLTVAALLLVVEPFSSMVAFLMLGLPSVLFLRTVRRRATWLGEEEHREREGMLRAVSEGLSGIVATKVLGREDHFLERFRESSERYARAATQRALIWELPRPLLETIAVAGLLGITVVLMATGRSPTSLVPTLTLLSVAAVRMIPSFTRIVTSLSWLRWAIPAVDAVHDELSRAAEGSDDSKALDSPGEICFDGVDFAYDPAVGSVLKDVSFRICPGEAVGLVGPSGSGKSTVLALMLGLLDPSNGRVSVGGQDLRHRGRAWRAQIGFVPQDIHLVDASIRRNIAFGLSEDDIDNAAVWRAVEAAQVREFVEQLPQGLDTVVGERGVRLSGGQRQRVAIAQALYHDPPVLFMDEATSALDDETERVVMDAIEGLKGSRTLVIVAHRASTVSVCDRLIRLEDGRLIESDAPATPYHASQ